MNLTKLPNIAELFDLFPYVMYMNRTTEIQGKHFNEFKYSYPLGEVYQKNAESEFLAYFHNDTMDLDRVIVRANSLNITKPFTLYASQPVTPQNFTEKDMEFTGIDCPKAT